MNSSFSPLHALRRVIPVIAWVYCYQLAGIVHLTGHAMIAWCHGLEHRLVWPWQRLVPLWGWYWNLAQPHDVMMVHVDMDALHLLAPSAKVLYGYAGILIQLLYMLVVGGLLKPYLVFDKRLSFSMYCNAMFLWTLAYMYGYAIHFYDDPTGETRGWCEERNTRVGATRPPEQLAVTFSSLTPNPDATNISSFVPRFARRSRLRPLLSGMQIHRCQFDLYVVLDGKV